MHAGLEEERRGCVAEIVEPNHREPCGLELSAVHDAEIGSIQRRPDRAGEDQIPVVPRSTCAESIFHLELAV